MGDAVASGGANARPSRFAGRNGAKHAPRLPGRAGRRKQGCSGGLLHLVPAELPGWSAGGGDGWRRRVDAEPVENLPCLSPVGDEGGDSPWAAAALAPQHVGLEDPREKRCPIEAALSPEFEKKGSSPKSVR